MGEIVKYSDKIKERTIRIKTIQDNVCQGMIEIGKELIEIKKELGHGQWLPYIENELGYSKRTAQNLIKIANEFGNTQTFAYLNSSRIIALLDIPQENREDFIKQSSIEDSTIRELKAEIQKYKEENNLLTDKQRIALEEKRKAINEKQIIEQQLRNEKNKPPRVETKTVEKVVEKIIDKTDYNTLDKLRRLEEDNKRLMESKQVHEKAMTIYKREAEKYQEFKSKMNKITCAKDGNVDIVEAMNDISELYININKFIKNELSPVRYEYCLNFIGQEENISETFENMINVVEDWCMEMKSKLNKNNNIITVEVN